MKNDEQEKSENDFQKNVLDRIKQSRRVVEGKQANFRTATNDTVNQYLYDPESQEMHYERMADAETRNKVTNGYNKSISRKIAGKIGGDPEKWDVFSQDSAMYGFYGFIGEQVNRIVESLGENFTHDGFVKALQEPFGQAVQRDLQTGYSGLKHDHAPELVKHLGLEDKVDPTRLDMNSMLDLLVKSEQKANLTDYVKDKPYRV